MDPHRYGLFSEDAEGPLCREFYDDLEEAKREARALSEKEGRDYFIFDFSCFLEVARMASPKPASYSL